MKKNVSSVCSPDEADPNKWNRIIDENGVCQIGAGSNLELCHIHHDCVGLVVEFAKPVTNAYVLVSGENILVEYWCFRDDIGDTFKAMKWGRFPWQSKDVPWGAGIGSKPGYVALRITAEKIHTIEDVVYEAIDG